MITVVTSNPSATNAETLSLNVPSLVIEITDLARGGSGVGRLKGAGETEGPGRVIFVPFTIPGDIVRVRVTRVEKRWSSAELLEIIKHSPDRLKAPCAIFGRCGGCQWQHVPYKLQWTTKVLGVTQALQRAHIEMPGDLSLFPAENPWGYRNRVQLRGVRDELGFYQAGTHDLVSVDRCEIARAPINEAWDQTKKEGSALGKAYKVEVEVLENGSIRRSWDSRHGFSGFRQVNDEQNANLREWVSRMISPEREIFDLYGGSGNLSLGLASRMKLIHCVDMSSPSEAPEGTPVHFRFHKKAVLAWLREQTRNSKKSNSQSRSAILDPPREGLGKEFEEIADALEKLGVHQIIAVGCDPDAWARDLSKFLARGWKLENAAVLDFFPQTPHVESVGVLIK